MIFKLNRAFREASGELDGLVYRNVRGQVVAARKPDLSNVVYSESQIAHRTRFKQAAAYGKSVMANQDVRALYEEAAKRRDLPVFSVTIADYFNAPTIHSIDLSKYTRVAGSVIDIIATDDFEVANVHVSIKDDQGNLLEAGNAVEESGRWLYTANQTLSATVINVTAIATDRPGGTAVKTETMNF